MIRVQQAAFDTGHELQAIRAGKTHVGGTALFVGSVREMTGDDRIAAMTLEHYPGMTEKALSAIEEEARGRWPVDDVLIVHRHGRMLPGEDIVLVICTSAHREAAFSACQFLMDWLKTKAPFWKLEEGKGGNHWVDAKTSDDDAAARWNTQAS
ncbi:MAG: molybdenum cofactor biosynthesis protein MoaE [Proteobacteria bacterium]|nr:molybdenum cofactor biosynthesis protein MoaE [Pseudomonadota bacterium]